MDSLRLSFYAALMRVENGIRKGYQNGLWFPHTSAEGGTDTIAYGHKLTEQEQSNGVFKPGISELEAVELLLKDFDRAINIAFKNWNDHYKTDFNDLPERYQFVLAELAFNTGSLVRDGKFRWPNLAKAILEGDDQLVYEHSMRSYTKPTGERVKLTSRTNEICRSLGLYFTPLQ